MRPRRSSARLAAAASNEPRDALTVLPLALPHALALRVWGAVPCDARLRCREVARAWRDALAEPSLWLELDLTPSSGLAVHDVTPALLRAAAARAGGRLERLYVACDYELEVELLAVLAANSDTLRLLRLAHEGYNVLGINQLESAMRAVPLHCVVEAIMSVVIEDAGRVLRCQPPFQTLRLRSLEVNGDGRMLAADVFAFTAAVSAHPSLRKLALWRMPLDSFATLDAVVDAALALRLTKLALVGCTVRPASAVALPRLLRGDALRELAVFGHSVTLLDAPAAALLADALRSGRTLTSLILNGVGLWRDADVSTALFSALIGHASLTELGLREVTGANNAAGAVGALVAADAPLRVLDVSWNALGDAGLGPLVDALPRNTHLRALDCRRNMMSAAFERERLMPALAANTSLQKLHSDSEEPDAFIAARTTAAATAARA